MSADEEVFDRLRTVMLAEAHDLERRVDTDEELSLETRHRMNNGQPLWFGGVRTGKRYVSYHLMPVYVNPSLLDPVSSELRQRMQGKSCFNFSRIDEHLFRELADLTRAGRIDFAERGYIDAQGAAATPQPE